LAFVFGLAFFKKPRDDIENVSDVKYVATARIDIPEIAWMPLTIIIARGNIAQRSQDVDK
jgi:hypothetical protein